MTPDASLGDYVLAGVIVAGSCLAGLGALFAIVFAIGKAWSLATG